MVDTRTVQPSHPRAEADLAPQPVPMPTPSSAQVLPGAGAREFAAAPATKRQKTAGERVFDIGTYGGFALVGNEAAAVMILDSATAGMRKGLHEIPQAQLSGADKWRGLLAKAYNTCGKLTKNTLPYFTPKPDVESTAILPNRFTLIGFAIIGGFLMVPFIKAMEDNKGKIVRFLDRHIYGKKADNDPQLVEAHKEMDNAPRQSWGSLAKGRILTVGAAYAVDSTINWKGGMTARMANSPGWSIEGQSDRLAGFLSRTLPGSAPENSIKQKKRLERFGLGIGLLSLSGVLTLLFYASSKLFASRRDHKKEHAQETSRDRALAETIRPSQSDTVAQLDQTEPKALPENKVLGVQLENTLASAAEREVRA